MSVELILVIPPDWDVVHHVTICLFQISINNVLTGVHVAVVRLLHKHISYGYA